MIHYACLTDVDWENLLPEAIDWQRIVPDKKNNWVNTLSDDFEAFIPLYNSNTPRQGIFTVLLHGWADRYKGSLCHADKKEVSKRAKAFIKKQNDETVKVFKATNAFDEPILLEWDSERLVQLYQQPFMLCWTYQIDEKPVVFPETTAFIVLPKPAINRDFNVFVADKTVATNYTDNNIYLPTLLFKSNAEPQSTISDWAVQVFRAHYTGQITTETLQTSAQTLTQLASFLPSLADMAKQLVAYIRGIEQWAAEHKEAIENQLAQLTKKANILGKGAREKKKLFDNLNAAAEQLRQTLAETHEAQTARERLANIDKQDILYYTYAVLNAPAYAQNYHRHLQYELPKIPFYADFWHWVTMGKKLMELHLGWQSLEPAALEYVVAEFPDEKRKPKIDRHRNMVVWDSKTEIHNLSPNLWQLKIGSKTALEWAFAAFQPVNDVDSFARLCNLAQEVSNLQKAAE